MSDLRKVAEIHQQIESNKEFCFESKLSDWLKQVMFENKISLFALGAESGLGFAEISAYRNDRKILTHDNAEKLVNGLSKWIKFPMDIVYAPQALMGYQKQGEFVNLVERREKFEDCLRQLRGDS